MRTADRFDTRTLPGTVRAAERAPIGFDVGGRVATVEVEIGEAFAAGDVLATLDETQLGLRVEERRSALAEAEAALAEAEADHRRTAHLLERGVESEAALDEAAAARAATRSRVAAARARLASARRDLADAQLRAPWDGRVAVRRVEPSERVAPGEPVLEIQSQHGGLELVVSAPETVVEAIARHERHAIRAPAAPGRTFAGRVSDVGARARGGAGFPVEIAIAPPAAGLRPGMSAEVTLKLSAGAAAESVAIPVTAYLPGPDGTAWAFVVDRANGTLERRAIALGGLLGRAVFVTDGLAPGETIVTKGLGFLREGQKVSLLGEGPRRFTQ